MPSHRTSFHLAAPPERVFDYIADVRNETEWSKDVESVTLVGDGPVGEGTVFDATYRGFGRLQLELREYRRPEHLVFVGDGSRVRMHFTLDLQPEEGGSLVTMAADIQPHGAFRALTPVLKLGMPREMAKRPGQLAAALGV